MSSLRTLLKDSSWLRISFSRRSASPWLCLRPESAS